jgi:DNA polymerase-3 subunit delta
MKNHSQLSIQQVTDKLENGEVKPIYFIYGTETYLIDSIIEKIASVFIGEIQKEINYYLRYATDTSIDELIILTTGGGLFSSKKVIVYKEIQNLKYPDFQRVKKYLENPDPQICLLFIATTDQIRVKKYQQIQEYSVSVHIRPLQQTELMAFVKDELALKGKKINPDALDAFLFLVGDQLHDVRNEISQVSNYCFGRENISIQDVENSVGISSSQNIFEYINSIADKDLNRSLFILHKLLAQGENPHLFIALLLRQFSILWKIQGYHQSGILNDFEIGKKLGIYSKRMVEYKQQLGRWKPTQLRKAMIMIEESEHVLKTSQIPPYLILDILCSKLVNC